jgi:GNAT superfamily N-acetyltransferase
MDRDTALQRLHQSIKVFYTLMGHAAPASSVLEYDGVIASLVPDTPERSLFNSVIYDRLDDLAQAYPELARRYLSAGVRAWTVWLMPDHDDVAKFLQQHGHKYDGSPIAMAADLGRFAFELPSGFDWSETKNLGTVAAINEEAYGMTGSSFRAALRRMDHPAVRFYVARVAGEPVSCVMNLELEGNCGLYCIATLPSARGQGLNTKLMAAALLEARQRGCTTATVQATPMGYNVFHTLGFADLGKMAMWELRR